MAFSDMMRRAFVDGRPVHVSDSPQASEVIAAAGQDPRDRDLVLSHVDGTTEIIPVNRRIMLRNGQRFETQLRGSGGN